MPYNIKTMKRATKLILNKYKKINKDIQNMLLTTTKMIQKKYEREKERINAKIR